MIKFVKTLAAAIEATGKEMEVTATVRLVVNGIAIATSEQVVKHSSDEGNLRVADAINEHAVKSVITEAQLLAIGCGMNLLGRGVKKLVERHERKEAEKASKRE